MVMQAIPSGVGGVTAFLGPVQTDLERQQAGRQRQPQGGFGIANKPEREAQSFHGREYRRAGRGGENARPIPGWSQVGALSSFGKFFTAGVGIRLVSSGFLGAAQGAG
jgi:hypothetical protein